MNVYIVTKGIYSQQSVTGVYATPELAMADNPVREVLAEEYRPERGRIYRSGGWQMTEWEFDGRVCRSWDNGLDWDEHCSIEEHELIERLDG